MKRRKQGKLTRHYVTWSRVTSIPVRMAGILLIALLFSLGLPRGTLAGEAVKEDTPAGRVIEGKDYLSIDGGKIIVSHHTAYVFQGSTTTVKRRLSIKQPFQLQPLGRAVQEFEQEALKAKFWCSVSKEREVPFLSKLQSEVLFEDKPPYPNPTAQFEPGQETNFGTVTKINTPWKMDPETIAALCRGRGYLLPDMTIPVVKNDLKKVMATMDGADPRVIIDQQYSPILHWTIGGQTGQPIPSPSPNGAQPFPEETGHVVHGCFSMNARGVPVHEGWLHPDEDEHSRQQIWKRFYPVCQTLNSPHHSWRRIWNERDKITYERHRNTTDRFRGTCRSIMTHIQDRVQLLKAAHQGLLERIGFTDGLPVVLGEAKTTQEQNYEWDLMRTQVEPAGSLNVNRQKRALPAVIAAATSIWGLSAVGQSLIAMEHSMTAGERLDELQTTVYAQEAELSRQAVELQTLGSFQEAHADSISYLEGTVNYLKEFLRDKSIQADFAAAMIELDQHLSGLETQLRTEFAAIDRFVQEVRTGQAPRLMLKVANEATRQGHVHGGTLVADPRRPAAILKNTRGGFMNVLFNYIVPDEPFDIYTVTSIPIKSGDRMARRLLTGKYLAVDSEQRYFAELDERQAMHCLQGPCDLTVMRRAVGDSRCLAGPIIGLKPDPNCPGIEIPPEPFFAPAGSGVVFATPEPLVTHLSCDNSEERPGPEGQTQLNGYGVVIVPSGCILHSTNPDLKFRGPPLHKNGTAQALLVSSLVHDENEDQSNLFSTLMVPNTKNDREAIHEKIKTMTDSVEGLFLESQVKLKEAHNSVKNAWHFIQVLAWVYVGTVGALIFICCCSCLIRHTYYGMKICTCLTRPCRHSDQASVDLPMDPMEGVSYKQAPPLDFEVLEVYPESISTIHDRSANTTAKSLSSASRSSNGSSRPKERLVKRVYREPLFASTPEMEETAHTLGSVSTRQPSFPPQSAHSSFETTGFRRGASLSNLTPNYHSGYFEHEEISIDDRELERSVAHQSQTEVAGFSGNASTLSHPSR